MTKHRVYITRPTMLLKGNHVYVSCDCGEDAIFNHVTPDHPKVQAWIKDHTNNTNQNTNK